MHGHIALVCALRLPQSSQRLIEALHLVAVNLRNLYKALCLLFWIGRACEFLLVHLHALRIVTACQVQLTKGLQRLHIGWRHVEGTA